jgi:hypothetical protein
MAPFLDRKLEPKLVTTHFVHKKQRVGNNLQKYYFRIKNAAVAQNVINYLNALTQTNSLF